MGIHGREEAVGQGKEGDMGPGLTNEDGGTAALKSDLRITSVCV